MRMITLYTPKIIIKSITRVNTLLDISLFTRLKHKAKYIITACIPVIIIKMFLLFFFHAYKNERKEHKF